MFLISDLVNGAHTFKCPIFLFMKWECFGDLCIHALCTMGPNL